MLINLENEKCVMIIDKNLELGLIANVASVLGITIGNKVSNLVGEDVLDTDLNVHLGITKIPIPILKGDNEILKDIRTKLFDSNFSELTVVDFSLLAQKCKTYEEYILKMQKTTETKLDYIGIAIYGNKKKVNKLTGNLPLLR